MKMMQATCATFIAMTKVPSASATYGTECSPVRHEARMGLDASRHAMPITTITGSHCSCLGDNMPHGAARPMAATNKCTAEATMTTTGQISSWFCTTLPKSFCLISANLRTKPMKHPTRNRKINVGAIPIKYSSSSLPKSRCKVRVDNDRMRLRSTASTLTEYSCGSSPAASPSVWCKVSFSGPGPPPPPPSLAASDPPGLTGSAASGTSTADWPPKPSCNGAPALLGVTVG
mmetsp:Transcript_23791/g.54014  ORF Transcript_23791/g.54014 Transcript_23791/m.54014 type:complete len:232 (-) Transcript_23791:90-785(-)